MHGKWPPDVAFLIWKGQVLVQSSVEPVPIAVTSQAFAPEFPIVRVRSEAEQRVVAYILDTTDEVTAQSAIEAVAPGAGFSDVMLDLGRYDAQERAAVVRAIAIERWSNRYRFCPACSAALHWTSDAIAKICTNPKRVHRHFPRLDPAIIVLVTDGDRALLGRSPRFPPGFYSTLAGFVEPGESLEAALRREVFEEAGIHIGETTYFGSESWPFPRSLMVGFFAQAHSAQITLHDAELEDARWFTIAELYELQARMKTARPFFDTIARRLIDTWMAKQGQASPAT